MNYYNDNDRTSCAWLRSLIDAGLIPPGDVDDRSIADVRPEDLAPYTQCHFFAGIGGWARALQIVGFPSDRPIWTGSCPCQPFSAAGKRRGTDDARHLWPEFARLIGECRPPVIIGEQVASAAGREWLAGVRADLEGLGYEVGAADLCAASCGAPHIRQRLYWVADCEEGRRSEVDPLGAGGDERSRAQGGERPIDRGNPRRLADARSIGIRSDNPRPPESSRDRENDGVSRAHRWPSDRLADDAVPRLEGGSRAGERTGPQRQAAERGRDAGGVGDGDRERREGEPVQLRGRGPREAVSETSGDGGDNFWHDSILIPCRDPKRGTVYRRAPSEPAFFPLADGLPGRVAQLRGLGNAIVPQVAAEFIRAVMEVLGEDGAEER